MWPRGINSKEIQNRCKKNERKQSKFVHWNTRASSESLDVVYYPRGDTQGSPEADKRSRNSSPVKRKVKKAPKTSQPAREPPQHKTTTSKYHADCLPSTSKPKFTRTPPPKPQIASNPRGEHSGSTRANKPNFCCNRLPKTPPYSPCKLPTPNSSCQKSVKNRYTAPVEYPFRRHNLDILRKARDLLDYEPESEFLRRIRREAKATFDCPCVKCRLEDETQMFKYTPERQLLEAHYEDAKKYSLNEIFRGHKRNKRTQTSCTDCRYTRSPRHFTDFDDFKHQLMHEHDQIHIIRHIRDENYFDTHATEHLDRRPVPDHQCIHKFVLDDRLYPNPIHADAYGYSCCEICNKPMKEFHEHEQNSDKKPANVEQKPLDPKMNDCRLEIKKSHTQSKQSSADVKSAASGRSPAITESENELAIELYKAKSRQSSSGSLSEQYPASQHGIMTDKLTYYNRRLTSNAVEPRKVHIPGKTDVMVLVDSENRIPEPKMVKPKRSAVRRDSWALRYQERLM